MRAGDIAPADIEKKGYNQDMSFMLIEIADNQMYFQVISRTGKTVDSGTINNPKAKTKAAGN